MFDKLLPRKLMLITSNFHLLAFLILSATKSWRIIGRKISHSLKALAKLPLTLFFAIFKSGWDQLKTNTNNKSFWELIKDEFIINVSSPNKGKKTNPSLPAKWLTSPNFSYPSFLLDHWRKFLKNLGSMVKLLMARSKRQQNLANLHILKSCPRILEISSKLRKIFLNC